MAAPSQEPTPGSLRINRFLAECGLGSRRSCEEIIRDGRVSINGSVCRSLGAQVDDTCEVRVDRKIVRPRPKIYVAFHKPAGLVCSRSDERGRPTIYDRLPEEFVDADYVGRLDRESEGLLLLTNDGDLALKLSHPKYKVSKEYEVTLNRPFNEADTAALLKGSFIEEKRAKADAVRLLSPKKLKITLSQGLKRQIRIMLSRLDYDVQRLVRTRFGPLSLGRMSAGSSRRLTPQEIQNLKTATSQPILPVSGPKKNARPRSRTPGPRPSGNKPN